MTPLRAPDPGSLPDGGAFSREVSPGISTGISPDEAGHRPAALSWALCVSVLLLGWGILANLAIQDARSARAQRAGLARASALGFARYADLHLQSIDALLLDLRSHEAPVRPPAAEMPMALHVALARADGELVWGRLPVAAGADDSLAQRPVFRALRQEPSDRAYVSAPPPGRPPQAPAVLFARPRLDANGGFMGVAVASADLSELRDYFDPPQALPAGAVALLVGREDGVARLRLDHDGVSWGQSLLADPAWNELASQGNGTYATQPDASGSFLAGAFQQVGDLPLVAVVAFGEQPWWRTGTPRLTLAAAFAAAFSVLLVCLTVLHTRPP